MAKVPATPLSLEYPRGRGLEVDIVERTIPSKPFPKKHDMFNIFDLVAVDKECCVVYFVQTTSRSGGTYAARRHKMEAQRDLLEALLKARVRVELHGWKKDAKGHYQVRVEAPRYSHLTDRIAMDDITDELPTLAEVRAKMRWLENAKIKKEKATAQREG